MLFLSSTFGKKNMPDSTIQLATFSKWGPGHSTKLFMSLIAKEVGIVLYDVPLGLNPNGFDIFSFFQSYFY